MVESGLPTPSNCIDAAIQNTIEMNAVYAVDVGVDEDVNADRHFANSFVPRPRFPTAADGLHHRYVESGSDHRSNFFVLWILSVTQSLCRHKNRVSFFVVIY